MQDTLNKISFRTIIIIGIVILTLILFFTFFKNISRNPSKGAFVRIDLLYDKG